MFCFAGDKIMDLSVFQESVIFKVVLWGKIPQKYSQKRQKTLKRAFNFSKRYVYNWSYLFLICLINLLMKSGVFFLGSFLIVN